MLIYSIAKSFIASMFSHQTTRRVRTIRNSAINVTIFVEHLTPGGDIIMERIETRTLRAVEGDLYICGWCQMIPSYRCVPVDRIVKLADDDSGEIVPRSDVVPWLLNRTLH